MGRRRGRRRPVAGAQPPPQAGERDAQNVGIFRVQQAVIVRIVGHPAQGAPRHLLAQQLRAELPKSDDVGHGAGVPPLGKHPDGHDAAHELAGLPRLADGIQHGADDIRFGGVAQQIAGGGAAVRVKLPKNVSLPDEIALRRAGLLAVRRLQLGMDDDGAGIAIIQSIRVNVGQLITHLPRMQFIAIFPAGDVVIQLVGIGHGVGDDGDDGRRGLLGPLRALAQFVPVIVHCGQGRFQVAAVRVSILAGQLAFCGRRTGVDILGLVVLPAGEPVGLGQAHNFDDAGVLRLLQVVLADQPGE